MKPIYYDLTMFKNDDPKRLRYDIFVDGVALDMSSGYSGKMEVRAYQGAGGSPIFEVSSVPASGSRIDFNTTGWDLIIYKDEVAFSPEGTEPGDAYVARYDILITDPAGDTNPWWFGKFFVEQGVTVE